MRDKHNIKRYIPKIYWPAIEKIDVELSLDTSKRRTVNFYRVWFKDGNCVGGVGITKIKKMVDEYLGGR